MGFMCFLYILGFEYTCSDNIEVLDFFSLLPRLQLE